MAKFQWRNGNQGFYNFTDLEGFSRTSTSATRSVLTYSGETGSFDPLSDAWRVVISHTGRKTFVPDSGPQQGDSVVTDGSVTAMRWFSKSGKLLLEVTGLQKSLAVVETYLTFGDNTSRVWDYISAGDNRYVGSADAAGPNSTWTGDTITTGAGRDRVLAGAGDDYIQDFGGKDRYDGQSGFDTVSYDYSFWRADVLRRGINGDLAAGRVTGPDGQIDTLVSIEGLRGTALTDTLLGSAADNNMMGLGGADVIDGRAGFDTVSYRRDASKGGQAGIKADLGAGRVRDGFGNTDRLSNVEGVEGTEARDSFLDRAGVDNYMRGRDGNDLFRLKTGNDYLRGDGGADRFVFLGDEFGSDTIEDFSGDDGDLIEIVAASQFSDLTIQQSAGDVRIKFGSSYVWLLDYDADDLGASDFVF